MAWYDVMPLMLRYTIGDIDAPQKYTDQRLQTSILIAAHFVGADANFSQIFHTDLMNMELTPDPTVDPTVDDWYANLSTIKAACQIVQQEFRILTNGVAIMFKEGSAMVDARQLADNKKALLDDLNKQYDQLLLTYKMAVRPSMSAVIGPFNIYAGNFRGPVYPYTQRDRVFI